MPPGLIACLGRRMALLRPYRDVVDPAFLLYFYISPEFKGVIEKHTIHGATVNRIGLSSMGSWPISVPALEDQRAIAEVLGAIDKKISANRKAVDLLSQLARAKWLQAALSAESVPLGTVVEVGLSGVWGEDSCTETATVEVLALRGRDLEDLARRREVTPPRRWITPVQAQRRIQKHSLEIWTAGSGSHLGPTLLITPGVREAFDLPVVYSNFVKRLVPISGREDLLPSAWFAMLLEWERRGFENFKSGTAFPNLDVGAMLAGVSVPMLVGEQLLQVKTWADTLLRGELLDENRTLAATRDALLPQLMSGKLRVTDAEKVLEGVL
nr:hypothetical protein BJQ95_02038 [Cryobacterium sp. SO1]